jgi:hypothetical protein
VIAASRSFYQTFKICRQDVQGRPVYALDDGQWNIPELRSRLAVCVLIAWARVRLNHGNEIVTAIHPYRCE